MERVSSQLTIFLRIALPTIWMAMVFSFAVLLFWAVRGKAYLFSNPLIWIGLLLILGSGIAFIKFILWKVYRVDMDENFIYISNYFKTYKYPYADIDHIRESKLLPGRVFIIALKAKGSFGKEVAFLASQKLWLDFVSTYSTQFRSILKTSESK